MTLSPAEFERIAAQVPSGSSPERVRELLGEPLAVSDRADGGQTWLYVQAAPEHDQWESLSVALDASGGFTGLERKPVY